MHTISALEFVELDALDAPDDGWDWFRGLSLGVALGLFGLSVAT